MCDVVLTDDRGVGEVGHVCREGGKGVGVRGQSTKTPGRKDARGRRAGPARGQRGANPTKSPSPTTPPSTH